MTITRQNFSTIYTCFPGGKHKVLTMSYDDGKIYDRRLVALFNQYDIRGTFHINGNGLFGEMGPLPRIPFEEIKELYKGMRFPATLILIRPSKDARFPRWCSRSSKTGKRWKRPAVIRCGA